MSWHGNAFRITGVWWGHQGFLSQRARTLQSRHNGLDGVSNHQSYHCLLSRLFGRRSKKTSMLRVPGLCAGKSPWTGEFPAKRASNAENLMFPFDDVIMRFDVSFVARPNRKCVIWYQYRWKSFLDFRLAKSYVENIYGVWAMPVLAIGQFSDDQEHSFVNFLWLGDVIRCRRTWLSKVKVLLCSTQPLRKSKPHCCQLEPQEKIFNKMHFKMSSVSFLPSY